jgi:hypothetical protein
LVLEINNDSNFSENSTRMLSQKVKMLEVNLQSGVIFL